MVDKFINAPSQLETVQKINEIIDTIASNNITLDRINQSKALETGNVSTDPDVLADVIKYAHTTFDRSKVQVVGSPVVTDDGIASGFSGKENAIKLLKASELLNKSWTIKVKLNAKGGSFGNPISFTEGYSNTSSAGILSAYSPKHLYLNLKTGDNTNTTQLQFDNSYAMLHIPDSWFTIDVFIELSFNMQTGLYTWTLKNADTNEIYKTVTYTPTSTNKQLYEITSTNNYIGINTSWTNVNYNENEEYDLKQFSITVDGKEVYNCLKTGVDTIKPDDYTVVGTPTISADGVASGLSQTNYVNLDEALLDVSKPWDITIAGKTGTLAPETLLTFSDVFDNRLVLAPSTSGFSFRPYVNNTLLRVNSTVKYASNIDYHIKIGWTGTEYYIDVNGVKNSIANNTPMTYQYIKTSTNTSSGNEYWKGSIDLNSIQFYVNGNLVYQPCLKIPYTLSKTGSKIVEAQYRDRVQDMYEQFGYAPYYTLDEENGNFTLPMGEIYGLIARKANADLSNVPANTATTAIDGQWVNASKSLRNGAAPTKEETYDLSDYLPKDNYNYEVFITGWAVAGTSASGVCPLGIFSDILTGQVYVFGTNAYTTMQVSASGSATIPIGAARSLRVRGESNYTGTLAATLLGYRRIGTNK